MCSQPPDLRTVIVSVVSKLPVIDIVRVIDREKATTTLSASTDTFACSMSQPDVPLPAAAPASLISSFAYIHRSQTLRFTGSLPRVSARSMPQSHVDEPLHMASVKAKGGPSGNTPQSRETQVSSGGGHAGTYILLLGRQVTGVHYSSSAGRCPRSQEVGRTTA